jgi:hypothetical protein
MQPIVPDDQAQTIERRAGVWPHDDANITIVRCAERQRSSQFCKLGSPNLHFGAPQISPT